MQTTRIDLCLAAPSLRNQWVGRVCPQRAAEPYERRNGALRTDAPYRSRLRVHGAFSPRVGPGGEPPPELAGGDACGTSALPFGVPALAGEAWDGARRARWNIACSRSVCRLKAGLQTVAGFAAACLLLVTLTGCLSRPPLARETFALTLPAAPESTNTSGTAVLLLRSVVVAPMFDGKALVYRLGEHTWEQDPYAEFLVPPAAMLAGPLRTALRRSGVFRDVIEPGSALTPDRVAEIQVTEFYGDFRNQAEPMAVLALRCTIFEIGPKQRVRLQKEYARRLALPERTAAGVVAGWNEALGQILGELVADLQVR